MQRFIVSRFISLLITMAVASSLIFTVLEVLPGDPAQVILGIHAQEDTLQALREEMGLNRPLYVRYFSWIGNMIQGDFGVSYTYDKPISQLIMERLPLTLPLAVFALIVAGMIGVALGAFSAFKQGSWLDYSIMAATQFGIAVPSFWLGYLLVIVFALQLKLLPSGGFVGWEESIYGSLQSLVLPTLTMALPQAAVLARITRSAMLEVLAQDYIRTAKAKGLKELQSLFFHALPNAFIPVLTIMGLQFTFLLAGVIVIENVFYLPGLGRLLFQALAQRDLIVVESVILLLIFAVVFTNTVVDVIYGFVDPRLRISKQS